MAPSTGVTVTVRRAGAPAPNVRVIFHDANGAVTGDFHTDATGVVTGAAPKQVTIVGAEGVTQGAKLPLLTYSDVADGDALLVDIPGPVSTATTGAYQVNITPPNGGASSYEVRAGYCNATGTDNGPFTIPLKDKCRGTGKGTVLGIAYGTNFGTMLAHQTGLALPGASATENVGLITWYVPKTATVTIKGLGPMPRGGGGTLELFKDGVAFPEVETNGGGALGLTVKIPDGLHDEYMAIISHKTDLNSTFSSERFYLRRKHNLPLQSASGDIAIEFDASLATPLIDDVAVAMPTPLRPELTWVTGASSGLTVVHGIYAQVLWFGDVPSSWLFVVDPSHPSVKAPELPADLTALAPGASAQLVGHVTIVSSSRANSFPRMKKLAMDGDMTTIINESALPSGDGEIYWTIRNSQ